MKKVLLSIGIAIVLMAQTGIASALVFSDNFNASTLDTFWWTPLTQAGNTVSYVNNRIEMTQAAGASTAYSRLEFNFLINGDFTADIDYSLIEWGINNKERLGIGGDAGAVERVSDNSYGNESYLIDIGGNISSSTSTTDTSGSLRLERVGSVFTGYYRSGSGSAWNTIAQHSGSTSATNLDFAIWPAANPLGVQVAFDNFSLNAPDMANPVPVPTTLLLLSSGLIGLAGFRRKKLKM